MNRRCIKEIRRVEHMKKNLTFKELIFVASMLFGMFFGAGNLIFPIFMGQLAGNHVWMASAGFLITGVGLPLLGVAALGVSKKEGLLELSSQVGRKYGVFFTCLLYLTIGPFFAIPRCATVSFTVGIEPFLSEGQKTAGLGVFSFLFFVVVLFFSLRPGQILTWIGKILNPLFLVLLSIFVIRVLLSPAGRIGEIEASGVYASGAFSTGLLEGYNTMDALAGLAFGIIVVNVIRSLGIKESGAVAKNTVKAGLFSSVLMALIYVLVAVVGAQSRGVFPAAANGGEAFAIISEYYFGKTGQIILALIFAVACLKTAIGLVTSCGETFEKIFPKGPSYRVWAVVFSIVSFLIANIGLDAIIAYSVPVLMFLYPLAVTLIFLTLFGRLFGNDRRVYGWVTAFTGAAAVFDFVKALPKGTDLIVRIQEMFGTVSNLLPMSAHGFGWVCPALTGLIIGLIVCRCSGRKRKRD